MLSNLYSRFSQFLTDKAPQYLAAVIVLVLGFLIARSLRRWLLPLLERTRIRGNQLLKSFFTKTLYYGILSLVILSALDILGFDVRTFLAGMGITGLIIGFGLRDTVSNFAAGLLLLIYQPFQAGDTIEVDGTQGVVEEMTIVNIKMTTGDGVPVFLPNGRIWGNKITNYSWSTRRRIEVTLKVLAGDYSNALRVILEVMQSDSRILKEPPPSVYVSAVEAEVATVTARAWTAREDYGSLNATAFQDIHDALLRAGLKSA